jgi:hypothetical protein
MTRDSQRQRTYDAEKAAMTGWPGDIIPADVAVELAATLCATGWWRTNVAVAPTIRPGRRDSQRSSCTIEPNGRTTIRFSPYTSRTAVTHELAHVADRTRSGHGPTFRGWHVRLAHLAFGHDIATNSTAATTLQDDRHSPARPSPTATV